MEEQHQQYSLTPSKEENLNSMATEIKKIISRRDTAANWQSNNPVLANGEIGVDTTNKEMKIGDGKTAWNDLKPFQKANTGMIVPPNNLEVVITDTEITIPAATRIYYNGKVHRLGGDPVTVKRVATSDSGWSEEVLVLVESTGEFKCIAGGNYSSEYTSDMVILAGLKKGNYGTTLSPQIFSNNYMSELCVAFGKKVAITNTTVTIPSNSRIYYNRASYYAIGSDVVLERELGAQQQFVMFDYHTKEIYLSQASKWGSRPLTAHPLFWVSYSNDCSLNPMLYTVNGYPAVLSGAGSNILDLNPKDDVEPRLIAQTKNKAAGVFTLLHFSDLHSSSTNLQRIIQFREAYEAYITDAIHTGDTVNGIITDSNPFESVAGAGNILNVIGNHEAWLSYDIPDYTATPKQCYDKIFAHSIANWGVTQPTGASSNGHCYYYKDYADKNIRLIVLDSVHWHTRGGVTDAAADQKAWFISTLASAKALGYTVVAAIHYPPVNGVKLVHGTGFSRYSTNEVEIWGDGWYSADEIFGCVDDFIAGGGKFATWLAGHTHYDMCGQVNGHDGQFMLIIQSSSRTDGGNYLVSGTKTQDAFNITSVDPSVGLVKVTRIGNDMDEYMQSKNTLCYDYLNKKIVYTT